MKSQELGETQKYLIYAIVATEFVEEIDYLKSLIKRDYPISVLYQFLSLAIVYLEIVEKQDLSCMNCLNLGTWLVLLVSVQQLT